MKVTVLYLALFFSGRFSSHGSPPFFSLADDEPTAASATALPTTFGSSRGPPLLTRALTNTTTNATDSNATTTPPSAAPSQKNEADTDTDIPLKFCDMSTKTWHDHETQRTDTVGPTGGTVMYPEGFRSSFDPDPDTPCLNLLFTNCTLDQPGKVVAGVLSILLLAVAVEGASYFRLRIKRNTDAGWWKKTWYAALHGVQALMGYVLMLSVMTFSGEMLIFAVVGLSAGYAVFFLDDNDGVGSPSTAVHVTTSPCCAFMTDEALEYKPLGPCQCQCALDRKVQL